MIPTGAIESVRATLDEIVRRSAEICRRTGRDAVQIMEVCGTHTMSFAASGLRGMLPDTVRLLSGPGCPVCVTTPGDVDRAVWFARKPGVTLVTFGDIMKVPGGAMEDSRPRPPSDRDVGRSGGGGAGSLSDARALGA